MKATLEKIAELQRLGIFERFAIGGGIAHFYYIEAGTTYDLDIMLIMNIQKSGLVSLSPIYEWAKKSGYEISEEHIVIEGVPVQFLPSYNQIVADAITTALEVEVFGIKTFIMKPEYLMLIMLETNRPKDRERLIKFLSQAQYSLTEFNTLLQKFNLTKKYTVFKKKYYE